MYLMDIKIHTCYYLTSTNINLIKKLAWWDPNKAFSLGMYYPTIWLKSPGGNSQQLFANVKSALGDQKYIDFKQKDPK